MAVGDGVYRYFFTATFGTGAVTVDFDGAEWETNAGTTGHGPDETFTVLGPTGTLGDPGDQASTGPQNLNGRGYLDVGITAPAGKTLDLATVYDEAAEFTLKGAGGTALAGLQLDAGQTPLLLRRTGNTWFFRYWTRGTYTSGPVTIDFTPGGYGFTDATVTDGAADTTPVDFTVGGVATPNIGWLDVILAPTSAGQLVTATITDAEAEFSLSGTGVGTAALLGAAAPTRLGTSGTWRYYFTGDFRTGDVDVTFGPGTFQSGAPGVPASNVGNLADTQTFFLESITAELGDPSLGAIQGTDTLNRRGFFEVTFAKPAYATGLDVASVTDLAPEFTVTTPGVELDANRAPVLIDSTATTWTFRYFFNGPKNAAIAYDYIGGSVDFTDGQGAKVPLFAPRRVKVVRGDGSDADTDPDDLLIEVPFGELGSLDDATIASADLTAAFTGESATTTLTLVKLTESDSRAGVFRFEITSPPAGLTDGSEVVVNYTGDFTFGGVSRVLATGNSSTPDPDGTFIEIHVDRVGDTALDPASLANADIALSGDGVTDAAGVRTVVADPTRGPELLADGETVRYYLTGAFEKGRVQVDWADGAWRDTAGDASVAGSGSFHLIEALEASDAAVPEKIFFIDISGGLELRLADVFDENILEIRGKVSLEIGNVTIDGRKVFRFKLDASGTIKVIKLGNIASGAATFVLQSSGGLSDLEFWGVATFATNLSFLEQYGIFLQGSVLLQVNTTGTTKTETLSLEGIPGGTAFLLPVAGAPPLPSGTFSPAPLDAAWIAKLKTPGTNRDLDANDATSAYTLNTGQTHQLQPGFTGVDLTGRNPTVEGLVAGKKWRIKTNDGRYFFIERETLLNGTDVYVVRTEERVYDLAPRSVVFEIVGGARIVDPSTLNRPKADQTVWFELYGGFRIELNPRRFELFITAGGSVKALGSLSGRLIGLLIVEVDPPHAGEPGFDANALPGVAGMLSLELDASLGGGDTGLSDVDDFFSFEAKVKITLNTTRREQVFTVPPSFLDVLPSDFPSTITIFESMPNLRGDAELNPASDGAFYVQGNISGSIRLANVLTLAGFLSFTASTEGVRIAGAVSGEIQYVGAVSGSLDLLFLTAGPEIVGRVTLFVSRGAGNLKMSGALLVEVNSTGADYVLETFLVKKDDASPAMAPDDPDQYQLSDHDAGDPPGIDIGDVTIAAGFRIFLGGKIEVGPLEVSGSFTIEINPTFVQFTAVAKLKLGDIGQLNFTGAMRFDADGLVINTTISLAAGSGFGSAIDLDISGSITFQLNTSNKVKNVGGLVDPGFRFRIQAAVTFIGFADATGVIEISINQDKFELYFDVAIALGPITVRATGFAGVYADGLVLYLDVALDVNLLDIVKMNASGKLRLNTTAAPKTIPGGISIDVGFRLAMTGQLKVLEVITLQATFVMQVGGTGAGVQVCSGGASICNDPDSGIGHVEQLSKGDWFISLTATADFFGLASMSASGWIDSKGHFGLRLHGEMVLGSRSFGLVGEFTFSVLLKEETNPANGLTEYHFRVFFSADVDARLFGITFAGVGLSASVEARGAGGEVDLVASVTVRIKILFIRISKTVRFKIGTIQLPKQVYLAGEGPSATVGTALWRGATTPQALYLNMGQRAQANGDFTGRGIGDSNASEIFIIEHVGGTAGNETLRVKGMGREKTYVGVTMLYAYAGNGSDTIIVREGVLVDVHLEGGAGRDVILFSGSGNAVICGDRCSGTAAGVEGTPVHEDDDSDSSTPAENDDENPAVNDTPEPGDDAIEIGLRAGGACPGSGRWHRSPASISSCSPRSATSCSPRDLDDVVEHVRAGLPEDGVLVLCHWRHEIVGWPLDGPDVHRIVTAAGVRPVVAEYRDRDFELLVLAGPDVLPDPSP